ncbi:hypothetical protein [Phenylobacterium immobile]|uniref:hypothetical protein n=1 Tax=Phenylobacterium immobile TaxID=21 RepID=UPI000A693EAF|nr:hypothetical protein [Phenylobacterium immobile]
MANLDRSSGHPVLNATRARQGRFGRHMFWVLLVSTTLAALALFAAWTWRADDLAASNSDNGGMKPAARTFNAPTPQPIANPPSELPASR